MAPYDDGDEVMDKPQKFDIVFTEPPGAENTCSFVEVEDMDGNSIEVGGWLKREDGYWVLRIDMTPDFDPLVKTRVNMVQAVEPVTAFERLQRNVIDDLVDWANKVRGKKPEKKA